MLLVGTRRVTDRLTTIVTFDQQLMIWITGISRLLGIGVLLFGSRVIGRLSIVAGGKGLEHRLWGLL